MRNKGKRESQHRSRTVKLSPNIDMGSPRKRKGWKRFLPRFRKSKQTKYNPIPSMGVKFKFPTKKNGEYTSLYSDASDDEEIYSVYEDEDVKKKRLGSIIESTVKLTNRAKEAFANPTILPKRDGLLKRIFRPIVKAFDFVKFLIVAFFMKCCGKKEETDHQSDNSSEETSLLTEETTSESYESEAGKQNTTLAPSSGPQQSFKPKTDISGRFIVGSRTNEQDNRLDETSTYDYSSYGKDAVNNITNPNKSTNEVLIDISSPPKENNYLKNPPRERDIVTQSEYVLLRHHLNNTLLQPEPDNTQTQKSNSNNYSNSREVENNNSSGPTSVANSSAGGRSTSVTSISSSAITSQKESRDLSLGDAPASTPSPNLPNVLRKTRDGFRRENRRMDALLRQWEHRSSSCVVIDETKRRERESLSVRATQNQRKSTSVQGRFLNIKAEEKTKVPPRLLYRRNRQAQNYLPATEICQNIITKSVNIERNKPLLCVSKTKKLSKDKPPKPSHHSKTFKLRKITPISSINTSEIDDIISVGNSSSIPTSFALSSAEEKVNDVTIAKPIIKKTTKKEEPKSNEISKLQRYKPTSHSAAVRALQSATHAFLTSDDENVTSPDDDFESFWRRKGG